MLKTKKLLTLVYPPKISTGFTGDISLALLYLAGAARDSGICDDIRIFDFNTPIGQGKTIEDLLVSLAIMHDGQADVQHVVAINCLYSALFPAVREISSTVKEKFPFIKIAVGGMHPTFFAKEIISNCPEIDAVSIGESDMTFPELLRFLYEESPPEGSCTRFDGNAVVNTRPPYIDDLDSIPMPG